MKTAAAFAALLGLAAAHMEMKSPAPFKSKYNDHAGQDIDYSMTNPLDQGGSDFPCKGYNSLLGTPAGASVANWAPGSQQSFTVTGGAIHNGGSCQVSLSYDKGETWTVIHSYIGNCPSSTGDTSYDFTLPNDTPAGEAIFAWSWFNNVGNREMYMNCAAVTIGGGAKDKRSPEDPFDGRPAMFAANVGNGCSTEEGKDLEFPNPGSDVTRNSSGDQVAPPKGSCATGGKSPKKSPEKTATKEPTSEAPATSTKASIPGGVFHTVPTAQPTTMATVTKSAAKPAPTGSTEGAMKVGEACDNEGEWNCVGGSQFQRCASGAWSGLTATYSGTKCNPGRSSDLTFARV